jgi:hypothetical protein
MSEHLIRHDAGAVSSDGCVYRYVVLGKGLQGVQIHALMTGTVLKWVCDTQMR